MRKFNFNIQGFERQVEKFLSYYTDRIKSLMDHVIVSPTFHNVSTFQLQHSKSKDLFELAILSWYLGDLGILLRLDIEERVRKLEEKDFYKIPIGICLRSKEVMLLFLLETSLWSSEEFFGAFFQKKDNPIKKLRTAKLKKVVQPQRKRGYNDQGSRAEDSYWKYARNNSDDYNEQVEIEERRKIHEDLPLIIKGSIM